MLYCYFTGVGDPFWNMVVDEWLMSQAAKSSDVAFLRVYSWSQDTISIGFHQQADRAVDLSRLNGTPVVRRITGGRAVLHETSELTYSVAAPIHQCGRSCLGHSVADSSRNIAQALAGALSSVGIRASLTRKSEPAQSRRDRFHTLACFDSAARYELKIDRRKIVASAQRRSTRALLQHGSVKLIPPHPHPALSTGAEPEEVDTQPITAEVRTLFAASLRTEFENRFELQSEQHSIGQEEAEELAIRQNNLRQNPLSTRTIY